MAGEAHSPPAMFDTLTAPIRRQLRQWVISAFPREQTGNIDYDAPAGDVGLFGPDSVTWRIHADFAGMLSGGLCALMLQTLHPRALAGVWDHSNFREDLVGRLRRTTAFVAGTTYGPAAAAQAQIARVRRIHAGVVGTDQDGRPYSAEDPQLLTWVHVTEAYGFLEGYRRYHRAVLPPGVADRYYDETRRIAEALGARGVPRSERGVQEFFRSVYPELAFTERSRTVLAVLARMRLPVPVAGLSRDVFLGAGAALLPDWAVDLLRLTPAQRAQHGLAAGAMKGLASLFRASLTDGVAVRSCRRVGVDPGVLRDFPLP